MKFLRVKHLILTTAAMLSLFVSAVSACACTHHETVKVEASSCHSSHETPPVETSNAAPHFESDCNCFVRTPVPAVVAKKDEKRTAVEEQVAELVDLPTVFAIRFEAADPITVAFEPPPSDYQYALLSSLPSRAPPRL